MKTEITKDKKKIGILILVALAIVAIIVFASGTTKYQQETGLAVPCVFGIPNSELTNDGILISSKAELEKFIEDYKIETALEEKDVFHLADARKRFNDDFFAHAKLAVLTVEEPSDSYEVFFSGAKPTEGILELHYQVYKPEEASTQPATWLILAGVTQEEDRIMGMEDRYVDY